MRRVSSHPFPSRVLPAAAWALGFALTAWLAGVCLPPPELPSTVREKLAHLAEHGDDYDAIFVGSSRIQYHIMPTIFDRLATAGGHPMKSFNAGVSSMHTPEDAWYIEQILAHKPRRLRWVFLEIGFFDTAQKDGQKGTLRGVPWHDWTRFRQLCRRLTVGSAKADFSGQNPTFFERLNDFVEHLATFGHHETQLGRGMLLFDRWRLSQSPEPMVWETLGQSGDGWMPANPNNAREEKSGKQFAASVARLMKDPPHPSKADRVSQAVLGEAIAQIVRAGATPVLIMPPRTQGNYFVPSAENARRAAIVDFCSPVKFPELYELRYRVDSSHLNPAGAQVFTRILAERFLEIATAQKSTP